MCMDCGAVTFGSFCELCSSDRLIRISDNRYREVLINITGKSSCSQMKGEELKAVVDFFNQAGWPKYSDREQVKAADAKAVLRTIVRKKSKALYGDSCEQRVNGFCQKVLDVEVLEDCDFKQLRRVIGWLRRYQKYHNQDDKI